MPRLIPESPVFVNDAERVVQDGLGLDDVVLANLRLTDKTKDHEADLVVLCLSRDRGAGGQGPAGVGLDKLDRRSDWEVALRPHSASDARNSGAQLST